MLDPNRMAAAYATLLLLAVSVRAKGATLKPVLRVDLMSDLGQGIKPPTANFLQFLDNNTLGAAIVVRNPRPPMLIQRGEEDMRSPCFPSEPLLTALPSIYRARKSWPRRSFPKLIATIPSTITHNSKLDKAHP